MAWSPSTPPKDRVFIGQDKFDNVGSAVFHPDLQKYVFANTDVEVELKFWQDFPKPMTQRDHHGAKIRGRI